MQLTALFACFFFFSVSNALLFPQESETREIKQLDGLWAFVREQTNSNGYGFLNKWYSKKLSSFQNASFFPVSSAFNDLSQDRELRDHVGWVWYQKSFFLPSSWAGRRMVVYFSSVNYFAAVWLDGLNIVNHTGGHLPFECEIGELANVGHEHVLTVAINNTLSHDTIPPGEFQYKNNTHRYPVGFFEQKPNFDFFNYAGILRPVHLYSTTKVYIEDITLKTKFAGTTGILEFNVKVAGQLPVRVQLKSKHGLVVVEKKVFSNTWEEMHVSNVELWWPRGMTAPRNTAYLYQFQATVQDNSSSSDVYRLPVGFRTVSVTKSALLINSKPAYLYGFGMHEDADIRGRGYDPVIMVKDLNLLEWTGANSFRTSHYPYSEERYWEADRRGILIIAETPAVGLKWFTSQNLELHKQLLRQVITRDKNHPSVVLWSLSNEPSTSQKSARPYYVSLVALAQELDPSRPTTIVFSTEYYNDKTADLVDVICINRYYGWYRDSGHTEQIEKNLKYDVEEWSKKFGKPIIVTEYGAGAIADANYDPPMMFSEAYQVEVMREYFKAFDALRAQKLLAGEMIWNFADFMTAQSVTRVAGNRKGVFKRNRQPKMAAYIIKERYTQLKQGDIQSTFSF